MILGRKIAINPINIIREVHVMFSQNINHGKYANPKAKTLK